VCVNNEPKLSRLRDFLSKYSKDHGNNRENPLEEALKRNEIIFLPTNAAIDNLVDESIATIKDTDQMKSILLYNMCNYKNIVTNRGLYLCPMENGETMHIKANTSILSHC
jgi:hypothetical protein